ncbi:hypothetical protein [Saccharopolyspora antimicrobica]|uniref:hypothetical protein n=1 Tax=Saccharopolyspora antimicrobica TaxID=455193 RepID=UPI001FE30012|nr:hypothetical protein [Saccharopolyspora antimicrobica]
MKVRSQQLALPEVLQDEVEQVHSGLPADVAVEDGQGLLAARDELLDDRRVGFDRRRCFPHGRAVGALLRGRQREVVAVED